MNYCSGTFMSDASGHPAIADGSAAVLAASKAYIPHASSWIAGGAIVVAFAISVSTAPAIIRDFLEFQTGTRLLAFAIAAFFLVVIGCQWQMALNLKATRFGKPMQLVTSGAFNFTRNPIYLAFLLPIAAFAWHSPIAAMVAGICYVVAIDRFVIRGEERQLAVIFGADYDRYCRRVPRWLVARD